MVHPNTCLSKPQEKKLHRVDSFSFHAVEQTIRLWPCKLSQTLHILSTIVECLLMILKLSDTTIQQNEQNSNELFRKISLQITINQLAEQSMLWTFLADTDGEKFPYLLHYICYVALMPLTVVFVKLIILYFYEIIGQNKIHTIMFNNEIISGGLAARLFATGPEAYQF